jgi:hypothetical protein
MLNDEKLELLEEKLNKKLSKYLSMGQEQEMIDCL